MQTFQDGDLLMLNETLPGLAPGVYAVLSMENEHGWLCRVEEDTTGKLRPSRRQVKVDCRDLPQFRPLRCNLHCT